MNYIDNIKKTNYTYKIKKELDYMKNMEVKNEYILDRIKQFNNILNIKKESTQKKKHVLLDDICESLFKKKWNNLLLIHKQIKIREYIKHKKIKNYNHIYKFILNLLKNKKSSLDKFIEYDSINGKIDNFDLVNFELFKKNNIII